MRKMNNYNNDKEFLAKLPGKVIAYYTTHDNNSARVIAERYNVAKSRVHKIIMKKNYYTIHKNKKPKKIRYFYKEKYSLKYKLKVVKNIQEYILTIMEMFKEKSAIKSALNITYTGIQMSINAIENSEVISKAFKNEK